MNSFAVSELKEETRFSSDLVLDKTFILCSKLCPVQKSLLKALEEWNFKEVYCESNIVTQASSGEKNESAPDESEFQEYTYNEAIEEAQNQKPPVIPSNTNSAIKTALENAKDKFQNVDSETARFEIVQAVYNEYLKYINFVYTRYATHKEFNYEEITETIKELCIYTRDNQRYILRIAPELEKNDKQFLVYHSMRSTVLAISIGLQLRMTMTKLVELGTACLLHEIGMLRLPPQIYISDKILTAPEKQKLATHPIISFNILKNAGFPLSIQLAVLEHHEKENGKGYPRHLDSNKISMYAKIISVACSFEAITSPRKYKESHSSYEAMIEMLKNDNKQYDETVVRALLLSVSLYPIGTYVYLSNGKIAQVFDVQPADPKNPVVQLLNERNPDGTLKTINTTSPETKIVRILNNQEVTDVLAALKNQSVN